MLKTNEFVKKHKRENEKLPIVIAGDYNAMPLSSTLSMLHSEDLITSDSPSKWEIPSNTHPIYKKIYKSTCDLYKQKVEEGELNFVHNNLASAYNHYEKVENKETATRR